jgi:endoglucanase
MNRRKFLAASIVAAASARLGRAASPRWRGFNLLDKFVAPGGPYLESDFQWIAEFGFNFVRLPTSYRCWTNPAMPRVLLEPVLAEIDQAIEWGSRYGIHVSLNLHRAPGYCINPSEEPNLLWINKAKQELCAWHWQQFAKRYRGIGADRLSFDLVNEPNLVTALDYEKVARLLVAAIRSEDPQRPIIVEGINVATKPLPGLADLNLTQAVHCYRPMEVTHYHAPWVKPMPVIRPKSWPGWIGPMHYDRAYLERGFRAWRKLSASGAPVHLGEFGCFSRTSHQVALAWMKDVLEICRDAGWGWALWAFRSDFGILDSNRTDVDYENFRGHKLDRQMLRLLQEH